MLCTNVHQAKTYTQHYHKQNFALNLPICTVLVTGLDVLDGEIFSMDDVS